MTLQTEDDDGSGRIREKWFGNHFVWDDGLMVHMHSLIHAFAFVQENATELSISDPENQCFEFLI